MKSEWKKAPLGKLCVKIGSGATPRGGKEQYKDKGISLIRSQNILDFSFSFAGLAYINEVQAENLANVQVCERDVLLNITGDSVARACMVPSDFLPARVNQHVAIIRGNEHLLNQDFLLYFLQREKANLLSLSSAGATRNALTKNMLEQLMICYPSLPEQKAIAAVLSALDNKIKPNNRINKNLEAQAQAIFKSWFVDFDPFQDGEFVESELGLIPKGWRVGSLSELINVKYGKDHKKLADGDIPIYGSGGVMRYGEKALYDKESVMIPRKGTLNNVIYINEPFWSVDTMFYSEMKCPDIAKFIYFTMKGKDLASMNAGSAVPSMTTDILNNILIVIPPTKLLVKYNKIATSIFDGMHGIQLQTRTLAALRNTLLPKLMSGEIRMPLEV